MARNRKVEEYLETDKLLGRKFIKKLAHATHYSYKHREKWYSFNYLDSPIGGVIEDVFAVSFNDITVFFEGTRKWITIQELWNCYEEIT